MIEQQLTRVSQELEFTKVNISDYIIPTEIIDNLKCTLDCRYWHNTNKTICCVLLLTTLDNRKIKIFVFKNRTTRNYNPKKQIKEDFCVRNNLSLKDTISISCGKSTKSSNIYLTEVCTYS